MCYTLFIHNTYAKEKDKIFFASIYENITRKKKKITLTKLSQSKKKMLLFHLALKILV